MFHFLSKYYFEMTSLKFVNVCSIILLSISYTAILKFIETYIYSDWNFLTYLVILVIIDTLTGVMCALKKHHFSSYDFLGVFYKIFFYGLVLIVVNAMVKFTIGGESPVLLNMFDDLILSGMMVRETISIFENIGLLYPNLLPKWILKKLKDFDSNGKPIN